MGQVSIPPSVISRVHAAASHHYKCNSGLPLCGLENVYIFE